jgi:drug/metabolite transporter (DMT)-like permease
MSKTAYAHLALLTAMCIYALSFSLLKEVSPAYIEPLGFVLLRILGATPLFWLSRLIIRERVEKQDLSRLFLLSIFGVALNQTMFTAGMSRTAPISGAIIMITSPLLVVVISNLLLRERITMKRLGGIALGLAGAALLISTSNSSTSRQDDPMGDLFILINALSWGTYLVLVKPLMQKYHTITILSWVFLFGGLLVAPLGWNQLHEIQWTTFTNRIWFDVAFIVFGITFIAYLLNTFALRALSPAVVSAYIYLQPLLAASIALYLGKDTLTWQKILSAALIFFGVWLVSSSPVVEKAVDK